jgi:hypothetical protein
LQVDSLNALDRESVARMKVIDENLREFEEFILNFDKITVNDMLEEVPGFKEEVKRAYFQDRFVTSIHLVHSHLRVHSLLEALLT